MRFETKVLHVGFYAVVVGFIIPLVIMMWLGVWGLAKQVLGGS